MHEFCSWHEADIKPRPLFGRFGVESGLHWLFVSISGFDPSQTFGEFCVRRSRGCGTSRRSVQGRGQNGRGCNGSPLNLQSR